MDKLKRQLRLIDVFCLAAGAMISSGLFVLPAIIYGMVGPAVVLVYLISSILLLPAILSQSELSTAMPRSGGSYFFVNRSLGPAFGFFSGLAAWFSIAAKSAFAIAGISVFVEFALTAFNVMPQDAFTRALIHKGISVLFCIIFVIMNVCSVKSAARFQLYLVWSLLVIIVGYILTSFNSIDMSRFQPFFSHGFDWRIFIAATGSVFISYAGVDYVTSLAEEIDNPTRNLPLGMILVWVCISILYLLTVAITVAVVPGAELSQSLTPVSTGAMNTLGIAGFLLVSTAAMLAFLTTGNAGVMSASRCPLAMSRDRLLPAFFGKVHKKYNTPYLSVITTGVFMIIGLVLLDLQTLVKTASCLIIVLYVLVNASVIIMRESRILSYRPSFKSPLYPYLQIAAIVIYIGIMLTLGIVPIAVSLSTVVFSVLWYFLYLSKKVTKNAAVMQIVDRVGDNSIKTSHLENELRDILIERDSITEDRFDDLIKNCRIIDIEQGDSFENAAKIIAEQVQEDTGYDRDAFFNKLCKREAQGSTVISPGLAIPHVIIEGEGVFDIIPVRSKDGIKFPHSEQPVYCVFVLAGSIDERNYHLRALMAIAQIAQSHNFQTDWQTASDEQALRNIILLANRKRDEQ